MAFALLIYKAYKLEQRQQKLHDEKQNALKIHQGFKPDYSLGAKITHLKIDFREAVKKYCRRMFSFPKGSWLHKTSVKMRHEGTLENYILKSAAGFVGGFFLTYMFFMFFAFILGYNIGAATLICSIMGCILTIGLAFSQTVRCIVFLILPQFFSKKGRQALIAYAFVLALTGPAKNTLNNMGIMSESLACGQEQLKVAVRQIMDVIKKPFLAIRDAIKKVIKVVKVIVVKIKEIFLTIKRIVMGIVRVIKAAFQFLSKIFNICSKKVGTPFQRCSKVFENGVVDCQAKLGPLFSWVCNILYVIQMVCYIVKPLDFLCMLLDYINTSIVGVIMKKIRSFVRQIRAAFYVRVKFSHSFAFETTQSKSIREISADILAEIKGRSAGVMAVFGFVSAATSCVIFIVVLRAIHYRYKFLTSERFDNRFITKDFREIDLKRAEMEKETILPLNRRERNRYVDITSVRLVDTEKKQLSKSLAVLLSTSLKVALQMAFDYGLYWLLAMIRYHGRYKNTVEAPRVAGLHVEGKGFIADLYRSIVKAFRPLGVKMDVDTVPCLPDPIPPNFERYIQIGVIIFLCWMLAVFEPYGLRLRHHFMCYYNPGRARERSVWLYNHILRRRNSFLKFARRQLRRKFLGEKGITKITFMEFLRAKCDNAFCRLFFLGSVKQEACLVCGEVFRDGDKTKPIRCSKPSCPGIYCQQCFTDLNNLCTICMEPLEYGDLSDVDEEKDSSEDETSAKSQRRSKMSLNKSKKQKKLLAVLSTNVEAKEEELQSLLPAAPEDETIEGNDRQRGGWELLDSDYYSENSDSTDYSFTYQFETSYDCDIMSSRRSFIDVEKQRIPDYVSMDIFRDDFVSTEREVRSSTEDHRTVFVPEYKRKFFERRVTELTEVLSSDSESMFRRRTKKRRSTNEDDGLFNRKNKHKNYGEEFIPLLDLDKPETSSLESFQSANDNPSFKEDFEQTEASQSSRFSVSQSNSNLDENRLETFRNNYLFPNVHFEEIAETSRNVFSDSDQTYNLASGSRSAEIKTRRSVSLLDKQEHLLRYLQDSEYQAAKYKTKVSEYYRRMKKYHN